MATSRRPTTAAHPPQRPPYRESCSDSLKAEENRLLTPGGPGTRGGELMRRDWYPIAVTSELDRNATKRVRLLGEDLVLFRDRSGTMGLIEPQCAHRRVDLFYGIPEANGL